MIQYQTSVGTNGYQNLLFPLSYMYISQGENGSYSHQGTYNIDFMGWGANGRIYHCPYFAPCDLKCIFRTQSGVGWTSLDKVNYVDGTLDYVTIDVAHDDVSSPQVGDIKRQGEILGYTGVRGGATGDHVHMNVAKGQNKVLVQNQYGIWVLQDSYHIYNAMGVDNTVIVNGYGYNWRDFGTPPIPPTPPTPPINFTRKTHFKFYLYDKNKN